MNRARSQVPRNWAIKPNHRPSRPSSLRQSCFEYAHACAFAARAHLRLPARAASAGAHVVITVAWGVARSGERGGMFHPTEEVITLIAHFARKLSSRSLASFFGSLVSLPVRPFGCVRLSKVLSLAPAVENRGEELRREGRKEDPIHKPHEDDMIRKYRVKRSLIMTEQTDIIRCGNFGI